MHPFLKTLEMIRKTVILVFLLSLACQAVDCPYGIEDDRYPGECGLYRDKNGDGTCDLSEKTEVEATLSAQTSPEATPTTLAKISGGQGQEELRNELLIPDFNTHKLLLSILILFLAAIIFFNAKHFLGNNFYFTSVVFVLASLSIILFGYEANKIYASNVYKYILLALLAVAVGLVFKRGFVVKAKPVFLLVFLPLWLMPALRCRFKVPYLFCHLCPGKCGWGVFRSFALPVYLGVNLDKRFWCYGLCPLGQLQDNVPKGKQVKLPRILTLPRFIILALSLYFIAFNHSYTLQVQYTYSLLALIILSTMALASLRVYRPFCSSLCPIGAAGDLALKAQGLGDSSKPKEKQ